MLVSNSFDTISNEYFGFYSLGQIYWITGKVGLKFIDVGFYDKNVGSFSITVSKVDLAINFNLEKLEK